MGRRSYWFVVHSLQRRRRIDLLWTRCLPIIVVSKSTPLIKFALTVPCCKWVFAFGKSLRLIKNIVLFFVAFQHPLLPMVRLVGLLGVGLIVTEVHRNWVGTFTQISLQILITGISADRIIRWSIINNDINVVTFARWRGGVNCHWVLRLNKLARLNTVSNVLVLEVKLLFQNVHWRRNKFHLIFRLSRRQWEQVVLVFVLVLRSVIYFKISCFNIRTTKAVVRYSTLIRCSKCCNIMGRWPLSRWRNSYPALARLRRPIRKDRWHFLWSMPAHAFRYSKTLQVHCRVACLRKRSLYLSCLLLWVSTSVGHELALHVSEHHLLWLRVVLHLD